MLMPTPRAPPARRPSPPPHRRAVRRPDRCRARAQRPVTGASGRAASRAPRTPRTRPRRVRLPGRRCARAPAQAGPPGQCAAPRRPPPPAPRPARGGAPGPPVPPPPRRLFLGEHDGAVRRVLRAEVVDRIEGGPQTPEQPDLRHAPPLREDVPRQAVEP